MGSTRQGRFGETVGKWFESVAKERDDLTFELIDLRDWPLPFFDHPKSPSSGEIAPEARSWANKIESGDAFVILTPEYNWGYPGVLKNALDHLYTQWNDKPVSFVGYGTVSGGARSVGQLRQVVQELQMLPLRTEILIKDHRQQFDDQGNMKDPALTERVDTVLDQLVEYARALTPLHTRSEEEAAV
jgi:NAD(P)H-dependent FMN reductase